MVWNASQKGEWETLHPLRTGTPSKSCQPFGQNCRARGCSSGLGRNLVMPSASPFIPSLPLRLCSCLVVIAQSSTRLTHKWSCMWTVEGPCRRSYSDCKLFWKWGTWKPLSLDHEASSTRQAPELLWPLWVPSRLFGELLFLIWVVLSREYLMGYLTALATSFPFLKFYFWLCWVFVAALALLYVQGSGILASQRVWVPSLSAEPGL